MTTRSGPVGRSDELVHERVVSESVDDHELGVCHKRRVLRAALERMRVGVRVVEETRRGDPRAADLGQQVGVEVLGAEDGQRRAGIDRRDRTRRAPARWSGGRGGRLRRGAGEAAAEGVDAGRRAGREHQRKTGHEPTDRPQIWTRSQIQSQFSPHVIDPPFVGCPAYGRWRGWTARGRGLAGRVARAAHSGHSPNSSTRCESTT